MKQIFPYNMHIQNKFADNTYIMKNKVAYYRNQQNMTLRQLSQKTGISIGNLDKIENDYTKDILLSNAIELSKALNVDLYELFCVK